MKIAFEMYTIQRGKYFWKMNTSLLKHEGIHQRFQTEWNKERKIKKNVMMKWSRGGIAT